MRGFAALGSFMIGSKRVVAVIPARAGSKGIKDKSIAELGGRPLLAWSIDTAKVTPEIDRVIVSTDGAAIGEVAAASGAEVYARPDHLATDTALVIDALRDLATQLYREGETARYMVLLEPTCPFRSATDISACLRLLVDQGFDSAATFREASLKPQKAWRVIDGVPSPFLPDVDPWLPRQLVPMAYELSGSVYAFNASKLPAGGSSLLFGVAGAVVDTSENHVDINDPRDLAIAEAIYRWSQDAKSE
jgi:CMP-N,N'-diacetyllegionaminic acid synthase